ncbi:MAG TPA: PDZ domain-containing protein [Urbifossiella sp.]|nr:PDZ domain-containing protein [Urbifossiella sp.]
MRRFLPPAALAGVALLTLGGVGFARQDEPKKADDPAPRFDPKDVRVGPPPELAALRAAVEAAAKKGENVDDVRAKLDALEKTLAGKAWVRPRDGDAPADPRANPRGDQPPARRRDEVQPAPRLLLPEVPRRGGIPNQPDFDNILRGQALLLQAAQLLAEDPNNVERAEAIRRQAMQLMQRALNDGRDGPALPPQLFELAFPPVPGARGAAGGNGRLGVRVERVAPGVAEDNNVPAGRGVLAAEVLPNTPAARAGVKANDVIVEFGGQAVTDDPAAFVTQVQRAKAGAPHELAVMRDGKRVAVPGVILPAADGGVLAGREKLFRELAPIIGPDGRPLVDAARERPRDAALPSGVTVEVGDGEATVTANENGVRFHIAGSVGAAGLVPTKIEVTENGRTVSAESVDGLPEQYRERARQLLGRVRTGAR